MDFRKFKPQPVKLSVSGLVEAGRLEPGRDLPLLLTPAQPRVRLAQWAAQSTGLIEDHLRRYGALLFRGFGVNTPELFEEVVRAVTPRLLTYTERSTPRTSVGGEIYTATEYPADRHIPLHNENSYSHAFPRRLWFCCTQPAERGGETPLADSREVLRRLTPQTRARFDEKGVMYVRNYGQGIDLDWQTAFQTASRPAVEEYCRGAGIEFEWRGEGRLRTRQVRPAIRVAPETGEPVWFNQAHLFHVSALEEGVRADLLRTTAEEDLTRNAFYGDGSAVAVETLEEIRGAYRACAVTFQWQRGDVLLVNNLLTAHGRTPYEGARRVLVAMADRWLAAPTGQTGPA
jgi:alpha-ketoglutarate-dependent taurine dioxygenase